jgi:DNA repair exonuclease SbcCD ATPase subunit
MRIVLVPLLVVLLGPVLLTAQTREPTEGANPTPPPERPAVDMHQQRPDDRPPAPPLPPGQADRGRPPGPRAPAGPGREGFGGPPEARPQAQFSALIRLIAERRPDLAERLERLRQQEPERFRDVLAEALIIRLEHILGEERRGPEHEPGERPPRPFGPGPEARFQEGEEQPRALEREHRELEERAEALERELHELEERDARPEARERVRAQLERTHDELAGIRERLEEIERRRHQPEPEEALRDLHRQREELEERARVLEGQMHELEEREAPPEQRQKVRAQMERTQHSLGEVRARLEELGRHRQHAEQEQAVHNLHRRHEELERRSHDLAAELRELRERGEQPERQAELMEALEHTVNEHFDVRTELREFELRRIRGELEHLQRAIEEMRGDLERRARERDSIVERRVRMLLGEDTGGW